MHKQQSDVVLLFAKFVKTEWGQWRRILCESVGSKIKVVRAQADRNVITRFSKHFLIIAVSATGFL